MLSDDGQIGVVFNGCIYNFRELRSELESRGCVFRSRADTEVLLHGYRVWGIDAMARKLRGMFAFAIWDAAGRKLTLVRDRLGVKPLLLAARGNGIAFASTADALRKGGFAESGIDESAVLDFLEFGFAVGERCIWNGIRRLAPATILEWQDGRITERTYWTLDTGHAPARITFEEAVEETEKLLVESVRLRLIADVPLGVLLSAGVDSSLVCWAMTEAGSKVTAFTVGTPGDSFDEAQEARRTAAHLGLPHEIITLPDSGPSLDILLDAFGEPFACSSALGMLQVCEAVKPHATALLTGDGGDDAFLGYDLFRKALTAQDLADWLPPGSEIAWGSLKALFPDSGKSRKLRTYFSMATGGVGAYGRVRDGLPYFERHRLLGPRLAGKTVPQRQVAESLRSARHLLRDVFEFHIQTYFTSEFMPKVDSASMYHAVEARDPFLDHGLWEFAMTLPPEIRLRNGTLKAVLREIARRKLGDRVSGRRKQGFTVPVEDWLATRWRRACDILREPTLLARDGWIEGSALPALVDSALASGRVPLQLWHLIVLESWLRKYAGGGRTDALSPQEVTQGLR